MDASRCAASSPIEWTSSVADRRTRRPNDRGEGADGPEQVDDPALIAAARHALHDEELIAAFAVDGENAEDPSRARSLIERCPTCRDLYADVVAIGATIHAAGTTEAFAATRPAPRDFRLTPMDAARLRPGNVFQRGLARLFAGAAMFGRPIGAGLATLGLVGLVVGTMTLGQLRGAAAPQSEGATIAGAGATSAPGGAPATTFDVLGAQPAASSAAGRLDAGPNASSERQKQPGTDFATDSTAESGTAELLFGGSILVLVLGVGLMLTGYRHARAWQRVRERAYSGITGRKPRNLGERDGRNATRGTDRNLASSQRRDAPFRAS